MTIRMLLADDEALLRLGMRMVLETQPDLEVVGEAGDGRQAVEMARRLRPDLVLMDVRMPVMDGIEATREIAAFGVRVLVLTTFGLDEYVFGALRAGAAGFLLKNVPPEQLFEGVRSVVAGGAVAGPATTRLLIEAFAERLPTSEPAAAPQLTAREHEILLEVARGLSNAEIAQRLGIGEGTVKVHVGRILSKLELRDRVQAVVYAYQKGLVTAPGCGGSGRQAAKGPRTGRRPC